MVLLCSQTGLPIMQHHLLNFWYDSQAIDQCQQVTGMDKTNSVQSTSN